jgi:thiol:disulfide interchange protein/DsbC/DsbD-like thiol-disulfide interchange protein
MVWNRGPEGSWGGWRRLAQGIARQAGVAAIALLAAATWAEPVKTDHVIAELVTESTAVQPGETVRIGLRLQHIPHWHTYWRNPGDSGLPTTLVWKLPAGANTGEIDWPAPKRLPIGPLVNYGYEGDLLLPLSFTAPATARPGSTLQLSAEANWLVCRDVCIPENATLKLLLPVAEAGVTAGQTAEAPLFARAAELKAVPLSGWATELQRSGNELMLRLDRAAGGAAPAGAPVVHVFPYGEQLVEPARHELYATPTGYVVRMSVLNNASLPASFSGIAVVQGAEGAATPAVWGGPQRSAEFTAPLREVAAITLPEGAVRLDAGGAVAGGSAGAPEQIGGQGVAIGLAAALLLAFVGGMVLNLMPCVLPVLSIKLIGLAQHGTERTALRAHAAAYAAGVLLSFLALAGVLLALRAAGSAVGWGFQLQEPGVVFVLALLFFALGLNLMGAFEFGNLLPQGLAGWRARRPAADAFASGVLAVVAASPCTAPFMGAALGYAITQPPAMALAVFGMLGLGMALPYVLLVLLPGWRARLPRPGPWMLRLKQGLAFPLFATVVWLLWVLGLQAGMDAAAKAMLALVGLAFVVWLAGALRGWAGVGRVLGVLSLVAMLGLMAWSWPAPMSPAQAAQAAGGDEKGERWLAYSDAALAAQLAAGKPVFVDFTAAWCVSCQVNKRLVLNTDATRADFERAQVVLMRADWTLRDPEITAALARLGRNGVPVYALMRPGKEPLLLPEVLTGGLVRDALARL